VVSHHGKCQLTAAAKEQNYRIPAKNKIPHKKRPSRQGRPLAPGNPTAPFPYPGSVSPAEESRAKTQVYPFPTQSRIRSLVMSQKIKRDKKKKRKHRK